MMKTRQTLNLSLTVPLAALALAACQPAQMLVQHNDNPTAVVQQAAPQVLPAGTLSGLVASYDGSKFVPVANAEITLKGTAYVAHTDSDGRYSIAGVPAGAYTVNAVKDGMVSGDHEIYMNSVMGTPRVNLALQAPQRSISAVPAAATVTVTGVVTDPRGSALPNANVKVLCNVGGASNGGFNSTRDVTGGITSDAAGFYTCSIPNVSVSSTQPGQVQVTSNGTSPGGVKLETTDVYAYNLTTAALVANPQCKAFTQPGTPTWPNGTFGSMGASATIQSTWLSSRTDEFYVELYSTGTGGNISQTYGVLPDSITSTAASGNNAPYGVATFRIPFTMPGPTFVARIIPFGLASKFGQAVGGNPTATSFVTNYTLGDANTSGTFEYDIKYQNIALANASTNSGTINNGLFVGNDTAKYTISLTNRNTAVNQDIQLAGTAPIGTTGISASYYAWQDTDDGTGAGTSGPKTPGAVTFTNIPAANITGPDASGKWTVSGFTMPSAVAGAGAKVGRVDLQINFTTPPNMAKGFLFNLSNFGIKMVSAALSKVNLPPTTSNLTANDIDTTNIQFSTGKAFANGNAGGSTGIADVKFSVKALGSDAGGAIRISDRTYTDSPVGANAMTTGTKVLPAALTSLGFVSGDHIDILTDASPTPTVTAILPNWDLETLAAFINIQNPNVNVTRSAGNQFVIKRVLQGATGRTLTLQTSSSADVGTILGVTLGAAPTTAGQDGAQADYTLNVGGANPTYASATQAGGTVWSFTQTGSSQGADGSVTATFTLTPPAAFVGADTFTTPIDVQYRIIRSGGTIKVGGANTTPGTGAGQSAPFGPNITAVNTTATSTDTTKDQAVGKTASDGTGAGPY